jgi:hypothetical protein
MMLIAPQSARLTERFGTRKTVSAGLGIVAVGLTLLSTVGVDSGYGLIALSLVTAATGMSFSMPPATTTIMSSLPRAKAGVGSAVNDTTRELGGALGVAVLGSIAASRYTATLLGALERVPERAAHAATSSVGAALQIAARVGGAPGRELAGAARTAFVDAMGAALLAAAGIALCASFLVARFMPSGPPETADEELERELTATG